MLHREAFTRRRLAEVDTEREPAPVQRRKRGSELRAAVHSAVLHELRERGFAALTMDAVAARARTGKATLYRYWPSKIELILDAIHCSMSPIDIPDDDGDLRGQLLAVLRQAASDLHGPVGVAMRSLIAEIIRTPEVADAVRPHMVDTVIGPILEVLRRAAVRGQIPAAALAPRVVAVGPDLLRAHAVVNGTPIPDTVVVEIVDLVLLPLLRGCSSPSAQ